MVYASLSAKMVNKFKGQISIGLVISNVISMNFWSTSNQSLLEYKGNWYYLGRNNIHHWRTNYRRLKSTATIKVFKSKVTLAERTIVVQIKPFYYDPNSVQGEKKA